MHTELTPMPTWQQLQDYDTIMDIWQEKFSGKPFPERMMTGYIEVVDKFLKETEDASDNQ